MKLFAFPFFFTQCNFMWFVGFILLYLYAFSISRVFVRSFFLLLAQQKITKWKTEHLHFWFCTQPIFFSLFVFAFCSVLHGEFLRMPLIHTNDFKHFTALSKHLLLVFFSIAPPLSGIEFIHTS